MKLDNKRFSVLMFSGGQPFQSHLMNVSKVEQLVKYQWVKSPITQWTNSWIISIAL